MLKTYDELLKYNTFEDRFEYLILNGIPGVETFGSLRHINQKFYTSPEWIKFRNSILIRDHGCDLGISGFDINHRAVIHHINPLTPEMILSQDPCIMDPNNVITCSFNTHEAIHYGNKINVCTSIVRKKGDTKLW